MRALGAGAACLRLRGCLALAEARGGGAGLREGVLALALRALLDLDVDIRWQDIAAVPGAPPRRSTRAAGHRAFGHACALMSVLAHHSGVELAARAAWLEGPHVESALAGCRTGAGCGRRHQAAEPNSTDRVHRRARARRARRVRPRRGGRGGRRGRGRGGHLRAGGPDGAPAPGRGRGRRRRPRRAAQRAPGRAQRLGGRRHRRAPRSGAGGAGGACLAAASVSVLGRYL